MGEQFSCCAWSKPTPSLVALEGHVTAYFGVTASQYLYPRQGSLSPPMSVVAGPPGDSAPHLHWSPSSSHNVVGLASI